MPSPILGTQRASRWPDEVACRSAAVELAARPGLAGALIELHGPLGAGKTTFVRHLLRALGVEGPIKSPTYALLEPYNADRAHRGFAIAHCDFYRFDDPAEWEDAGFREVFGNCGLKLVEWPEKAAAFLPRCDLILLITPDAQGDGRDVQWKAMSALGESLLAG